MNHNTNKLTLYILIALVIGAFVGSILNQVSTPGDWIESYLVEGVFLTIGKLFVASLKMMVVPLVLVSLVVGVTSLDDVQKLGRIGGKTIALYLLTTALAISIALFLGNLVNPGQGIEQAASQSYTPKERPPLIDVIANIIPSNPIKAMTEGNMLQVIVFAILLGVAMLKIGEKAKPVVDVFHSANTVVLEMVMILMKFAPIGVFCLIAKTFATEGFSIILSLIQYFVTVTIALILHFSLTYGTLFSVLTRLNPITFFKKMVTALSFAFSTASSNATIPVTMKVVEEDLGVDKSVASFTVPLGATINMDGTAIMQGVATVFIAGVYAVDLTIADYLTVILTATLASIGTAGVPGVGLIMLALVLHQVNLPVEGIALIIGVDRLLDMMRTAVNITGDAMVTCAVAKSEEALNTSKFENK